MEIERLSPAEWRDCLPESGVEPFHETGPLRVLGEHASGELRLYGGFKGNEPMALLPVVVSQRSMGKAVLSPPPSLNVPHLGPVLTPTSPKRRKREKRNRRFTEAILDELGVDGSLTLFRMLCAPTYTDPRSYQWNDLTVEPRFTYRIDVESTASDEIRSGFSRSLRKEIRTLEDSPVTVEISGLDAARRVFDDQRARYDEQEEGFALTWAYVRDLLSTLEDRYRVYEARDPDGDYLAGVVVVYGPDSAYYWLGGTRASYENCSVNSLLHWAIIEDLTGDPALDGVDRYDLVGANTERLCRYKAKFGPELVPYYVVESSGRGMDVAKTAYRVMNR